MIRSEPHPITGFQYDDIGNGLVKVTTPDKSRYGIFRIDGSWVEGELTHADPHLLIFVGGATLPDGMDVMWARLALRQEDMEAAARAYSGDYIAQRQETQGMSASRVVGKYVGDPGKVTDDGPRSAGWIAKPDLYASERKPDAMPEVYRLDHPMEGGAEKIRTDRFYRQEIFDLEVEKIWKRVWQMACRLDEIPEVGDYHVYEVATLSFLVVRVSTDEVKAYYNACLHRGRLLREFDGKCATEFRCPYHGWSWRIDGSLKEMTCEWDFGPEVKEDVSRLPEVKVGTWGGFIFINPDPDAMPLEEFLGKEMIENYARFEFEKRYLQVHVQKPMMANWKTTMEAFMEAYHVIATHPQLMLAGSDGAATHYDVFGHWARASGQVQSMSPHRGMYTNLEDVGTQRAGGADSMREYLRGLVGDAVEKYSDVELLDQNFNDVFPNFHPWGGWARLCFRFRPLGTDPDTCMMDVYYIAPWPEDEPKPPAARVHPLSAEQSWCAAAELGSLARIIDQDCYNMPKMQAGFKAKKQDYVWYSGYAEGKIRNFHHNWDRWMAAEIP